MALRWQGFGDPGLRRGPSPSVASLQGVVRMQPPPLLQEQDDNNKEKPRQRQQQLTFAEPPPASSPVLSTVCTVSD